MPPPGGAYEDSAAQVVYTGTWTTYNNTGPSGGNLHYTASAGSSASLSFSGTHVTLVYAGINGYGHADIFIDGLLVTRLNQSTSALTWKKTWTSPLLTPGNHTIRVAYVDGYYNVDAFIVRGLATATPTATAYTPSPTPSRTNTPIPPSTETFTPTATNAPTVTPTPKPSEPAPQALTGAQYAYDGDGTMMRGTINGLTTFYPGRHYNKEVSPGATKIQKFYFAGTVTIAVRTLTDTADTLNWVLGDHLGSASSTANADGTLNSVIQYTAFGEIRLTQGLTPTKYRYTGQLAQAELGLDFYVARWYDPITAHFTAADTIIPEPGKSQSWDRYSYVLNNPISLVDPSGQKWVCVGENNDHCYDDGQGKKSGMATSPLVQEIKKTFNNPKEYVNINQDQINLLNNGITISEAHGLCVNWGNIGCSGGTSYEEWLKNEYYPMYLKVYLHQDLVNFANASQNAAFIFSSIGAFFEVFGVPEVHMLFTNNLESFSSWTSTTFTLIDDAFVSHKSHYNESSKLIIDEGTAQSLTSSIVGGYISTATNDVLIDAYLVGYDYGLSKGFLSDFGWNGLSLFGQIQIGEK